MGQSVILRLTLRSDTAIVPAIFSLLEPEVAIICGCLPTMHRIFTNAFMAARATFSVHSLSWGSSKNKVGESGDSKTSWRKLSGEGKTSSSKGSLPQDLESQQRTYPLREIRKTTEIEIIPDNNSSQHLTR